MNKLDLLKLREKRMKEGGYLLVILVCPRCKTISKGQKHNNSRCALVRCEECKTVMNLNSIELVAERYEFTNTKRKGD